MIHHLTVRVPWHDSKWSGKVCEDPESNVFCSTLKRIRETKSSEEPLFSGKSWSDVSTNDLPPCVAESGGFMNSRVWDRWVEHPYQKIKSTSDTHGNLRKTRISVPPFTTFAVPFAYMLSENQSDLDKRQPNRFPEDKVAPFPTAWVFGRERQKELLRHYFENRYLKKEQSLVFFYTNEGHPLGDSISRLLVGVGTIMKIGALEEYDTLEEGQESYPLWDRLITHSIREEGEEGFLLPYHEYLTSTGDEAEDQRRAALLEEIIVTPDLAHNRTFSYASEHATPDVALSVLVRCLQAVKKIREHGIAEGPWEKREDWLNQQIAKAWVERGAFPGLGSALDALGMRLGTAMALELAASGRVPSDEDPWPIVEGILSGVIPPPQSVYEEDIEVIRPVWRSLEPYRKELLSLLSRFALTPEQCLHWYHPEKRIRITGMLIEDIDILSNPYLIAEADLGNADHTAVSIGMIDRGVFPENQLRKKHPLPERSKVDSYSDIRRLRAAIVKVLRVAEDQGDTLLGVSEVVERFGEIDITQSFDVTLEMVVAFVQQMKDTIVTVSAKGRQGHSDLMALQLKGMNERESLLGNRLLGRAQAKLPSLEADWPNLIKQAISSANGVFDESSSRHREALEDQALALERVTCSKLSVLVGRAGTGKTSVLGALLSCESLKKDGILLLAPTGKARVKLSKSTQKDSMTIAQFLMLCKRYDTLRQRPLLEVTTSEKYRKEKTIVIDESSMLNTEELYTVLDSLDLAHVQRIILVGDPNQLPPIGAGRPFADLVSKLESDGADGRFGQALGKLNVEVRSRTGDSQSDTLRLASWYTRELQTVDADKVFGDLELGVEFNDLEICLWKNADELRVRLLEQMQKNLGLKHQNDTVGFNKTLGMVSVRHSDVEFHNSDFSEYFQLLSPVRNHHYGVGELNRWIQGQFRGEQLRRAKKKLATVLGDEKIVLADKVIQIRNGYKDGWNLSSNRKEDSIYLANGEIGTVARDKNGYLNVIFNGRPAQSFGYNHRDFPMGTGDLELAYALSVHKSQGSEFNIVLFVIPKKCKLLSRELLYTALTRSKQKTVLLIEGEDASTLFEYTKPERSASLNRNTNLFDTAVVRASREKIPYSEHLLHLTEKGHLVRSKSELVIATKLYNQKIDYQYERELEGIDVLGNRSRILRPDFSIETVAGDLLIWEHLGMMNRESYRKGWEWKKAWYEHNGYTLGNNLFITMDDERGGLDANEVERIVTVVKKRMNEF